MCPGILELYLTTQRILSLIPRLCLYPDLNPDAFVFPSLLPIWVALRLGTFEGAMTVDVALDFFGGISFVYKVKNLASLKKCKSLCYKDTLFLSPQYCNAKLY